MVPRMPHRTPGRFLPLLAALAILIGLLPAQEAGKRRAPQPPGWQEQVNDAFGVALTEVTHWPFYDVAPALGLDTRPHRLQQDGKDTAAPLVLADSKDVDVRYAAFTGAGRRVLAADQNHALHLYSLFRASWRRQQPTAPDPLLGIFRGHTGPITVTDEFPDAAGRLQFTDDYYRIGEFATGSQDGTVRVWRLATPDEEIATPPARAPKDHVERQARLVLQHGAPVTAVRYSPSGRWLASGGSDGNAILWGYAGEPVRTLGGHQGGVQGLHFDGDDVLVVTDGSGGGRRWNVADGTPAAPAAATEPAATPEPPAGHLLKEVRPQGNQATLVLHDGTELPLQGHTDAIRGWVAGAGGTRALTFGDDGTVHVWEWLVRGPAGNVATVTVPFVVVWLVLAAVLFTLFFRFVNFRMFKHAIHCVMGKFSDPKDLGEVSHFQALSAALSATVGLGNIAGVAIAVMIGGPGATFWMIVAGLLGMTLKFTECTLGQKFRKIDQNGNVSGGPMHYLRDGFANLKLGILGVPLAMIFTIFCIGGSLAGGNAFQVNQSLGILRGQVEFFDHNPWAYGLLMAFFTAIVIIGGIRSIARVADKIVPAMCGIYVLSALVVILMHIGDVPAAIGRIFECALSGDAVYGGAIGALVTGFRRAAFSNEAGVGSASIAHSAARTPYPVREGIVALLEPFIDTVIVCTMTALVIGITGVYQMPQHAEIIAANNGAALTAEAFKSVGIFAGWFPWLLMVAVVLFAYSTMISWSYYGERCATNLFGPRASLPFKLLFLVFTVLGSVVTATNVLEFGDVMILLMAFPNIVGLYFLGYVVRRELKDYEARLQSGEIKAYK